MRGTDENSSIFFFVVFSKFLAAAAQWSVALEGKFAREKPSCESSTSEVQRMKSAEPSRSPLKRRVRYVVLTWKILFCLGLVKALIFLSDFECVDKIFIWMNFRYSISWYSIIFFLDCSFKRKKAIGRMVSHFSTTETTCHKTVKCDFPPLFIQDSMKSLESLEPQFRMLRFALKNSTRNCN